MMLPWSWLRARSRRLWPTRIGEAAAVITAWVLLGVAAVLVVGNAVFVAAETALVTVDRNLVESQAHEGSVRFGRVRGTLQRLSTYLSGAQLGITVTSLAIGLVAEPSIATLLRGPLEALGLDADVTEVAALALALLLATAVQMVFGELVPKNIALSRPVGSVVWLVLPLVVFTKLTRPLVALLNGSANQLLRLVGVEPVEELRSARTPDELAAVVRRAGAEGALGWETAALMERSLAFGAKTAADVMTPRTRVRSVSASAPVATVIEATRDTGHSRFPVIGDSVDDIRGVIHVKQAVAVPEADRTTTRIRDVMTAPVLVPPSIALDPLLDRLQQRGLQLAVVVDEYGGTAGIVTFEDLVEELIGDVVDEHDSPAPGIWRQPDGSWLVSGLLRPDEIQAAIGLELPPGRADYETVAGLILHLLRRIPDPGDQVDVPGATLTVDRLDGRRIAWVQVMIHQDNIDAGAVDDSTGHRTGGEAALS
jgi:CBS domain containing-hemolysin-like protein